MRRSMSCSHAAHKRQVRSGVGRTPPRPLSLHLIYRGPVAYVLNSAVTGAAGVAGPRQSRQAPQAYSEAPAKDWEAAGGWTDGHCRERAPNPVCGISATRSFAFDASEHTHAPTHFLLPLLSPGTMFLHLSSYLLVLAYVCADRMVRGCCSQEV